MASPGLFGGTSLPATRIEPASTAIIADDRLGELGAAGAHQAADADHLAATDREADVADLLGGERIDDEQRLAGGASRALEEVAEVAADHQAGDPLLARAGGGRDVDQPAVAQHGDAVGELDDLVQAVRDVDDRYAVAAQPADHGEEAARLVVGQRGGRLVEGDQAAAGPHGAHDLDHLPLRRAEGVAKLARTQLARPCRTVASTASVSVSRCGQSRKRPPWRGRSPTKMFSATVRSGTISGS